MPDPRALSRELAGGLSQFWRGTGIGDEAAAAVGAPLRGQSYEDSLAQQRELEQDFQGAHPTAAGFLRGLGGVLPAAAGLMAPQFAVPAAGGRGLLAGLQQVAGNVAKGATVGAGGAYASGIADAGTPQERMQRGNAAIPLGAAVGGAIPAVAGGAQLTRPPLKPTPHAAALEGMHTTPPHKPQIGPKPGQEGELLTPANVQLSEDSVGRAATALQGGDTLTALRHIDPRHHARALDDLVVSIMEFSRKNGLDNHPRINALMDHADDLADALDESRGGGDAELVARRMNKVFSKLARDYPPFMQQIAHDWQNELLPPETTRTPSGLGVE